MVIHMQQKKENDNIMNYDTVRLDDENNAIIIIDQTKLPGSIELIALKTAEEIWDAIYLLRVRGRDLAGGYPCLQKDRRVRSDVSETGRRHPDTLQCRSACHQQIWHSDSTDLSWRGKGISL